MNLPITSTADITAVKNMSRAERDALEERIKTTDPHSIFKSAGETRNADKRKIICPNCGNGTGDSKTPVEAVRKDGGIWLYNCFKCNAFHGNLFGILADAANLNPKGNFEDTCKTLAIGANLIGYPLPAAQAVKHKPQPTDEEKKEREERLKKINDVISEAQKNLPEFIKACSGTWRGLTGGTLRHFHCGYLPLWHHSKKYSTSPRVIIPAEVAPSTANYLARLTIPLDSIPADEHKWIQEKEHDGEKTLFNRDAIIGADRLVVVEGYIDAMTLWQAFDGKIKVVALGGKNGGDLILDALKPLSQKPKTLILFDADATETAENLRGELVKIGVPAVNKIFDDFISAEDKAIVGGKIDANAILVKLGADKLKSYTESVLTAAQIDFNAVEEKIARDAALIKRLDEWQEREGKINPKLLPEIKDAAEYVEELNADNLSVDEIFDIVHQKQIALLNFYLPRNAQKFFAIADDAVKSARQTVKELEKQKPPQTPDERTKELASIKLVSISAAINKIARDIKRDHEVYKVNLDCEAENARIERARAQKEKETTKSQITDCPVDLKIPMDCYFRDKGVAVIDRGGKYAKTKEASTTPIVPTAIYREPSKHTTAYEVAIKARGFWRRITVDGDELADSKKIIRLAKDGGALIESAQHLCKYFAQIIKLNENVLPEIKCYNKTGWRDDFNTFIYPSADADYIVRRAGFDFDTALAVRGDAQKWKNAFAIACDDSAVARIFLGYAFAAPLVRPLNLQNAQLLLHCKFNNGKSALQKLAASFYGNPRELIKSFSATLKYRQGVATAYCDLPTFLDEPEAGADKRNEENYSQMIYDYAEGKSNQANKRNGAARESENFYGTRVITSERPLLKPNAKNGAFKRMPQITCEKLFSREFAIYLHEFTAENYGHFGKAWTEYISAHRKEIDRTYHETRQLFKSRNLNVEETARDAIIAAAVATQYVFVMLNLKPQFDADEANATVGEILSILPTQDEQDEATRALKDLQSHFAFKEKSFVHEGNNKNADEAYTNADTGGDEPTATFDTSGKVFKNGEVAILPTVLRNWLEKDLGYASTDAIVAEWTRRGLLRTGKGRNLFPTRIKGRPTWSYRFKAGVLFDTGGEDEI